MRCRSATRVGDLVGREPRHALGAELLDVVRRQRGAVGHRAREEVVVDRLVALRGDVADEAAGEAVAGAGRVDDLGQRIGGQGEEAVLGEERRAVLALLGHDGAAGPSSAAPRRPRRSSACPVSCSSSSSLRIRQSTERIVRRARRWRCRSRGSSSPSRRTAPTCTARARRAAGRAGCWPGRGRRSPGPPARAWARSLEDVEVGDVRDALVEVVAVLAGPEERLAAGHVLDVVGDRPARLQRLPVLGRSRRPPGRRGAPRRRTTRRG